MSYKTTEGVIAKQWQNHRSVKSIQNSAFFFNFSIFTNQKIILSEKNIETKVNAEQ